MHIHKTFLNDIDRIVSPNYKPTLQDVLLARTKTTNVTVQRYTIGTTEFELYDVGGQKQYRNKWYDCFDGVDGVIFVAALSEYDQNLAEAKRINRLMDTLDLFRAICLNRAFVDTPIILFLNKMDLVAEKIRYSNIADQKSFADYDGPTNHFDCAMSYFVQKFEECLIQQDNKYRDIYIQTCTATDTEHSKFKKLGNTCFLYECLFFSSGMILFEVQFHLIFVSIFLVRFVMETTRDIITRENIKRSFGNEM